MINEREILDQLDQCCSDYAFPMLDNGYFYPITQRLNCYGDQLRWAIIMESVGYSVRGGDHNGFSNCLFVYGNCLDRKPGLRSEDFLRVSSDGLEGRTFDDGVGWYVNCETGTLKLRGELVAFDICPAALKAQAIDKAEERLSAPDLFRSLLPKYREQFLATEYELRLRIPIDIPLVLRLDDWYHPDVSGNEKPSENETFQMIAKVLSNNDSVHYIVNKSPNTHWKNWPEGGTY